MSPPPNIGVMIAWPSQWVDGSRIASCMYALGTCIGKGLLSMNRYFICSWLIMYIYLYLHVSVNIYYIYNFIFIYMYISYSLVYDSQLRQLYIVILCYIGYMYDWYTEWFLQLSQVPTMLQSIGVSLYMAFGLRLNGAWSPVISCIFQYWKDNNAPNQYKGWVQSIDVASD